MKNNTVKTRKSHPLLVWMVLLLAMTNIAILLEAERSSAINAVATNGTIVATSGDPMLYFASIAATVGSGLIILGAAVIWVANFVKQITAKPEKTSTKAKKTKPAQTATKTTKKTTKSSTKPAVKTTKTAKSTVRKPTKTTKKTL